jgi:hypothetical protein
VSLCENQQPPLHPLACIYKALNKKEEEEEEEEEIFIKL